MNGARRFLFALGLALIAACAAPPQDTNTVSVFETPDGSRAIRVSWYGDAMVRVQSARAGESFLPDDHYEMIVSHEWFTETEQTTTEDHYRIRSARLIVEIDRESLAVRYFRIGDDTPLLSEQDGVSAQGARRRVSFDPQAEERFTGLGHGYFARAESLDLTGAVIERNYGSQPIEQAPLIVPFYLSNRGYGVFLNSTFPNRFALNDDGDYSIEIDTHGFEGQLDYVFIDGPSLRDVLDHYTQLTGRPRLPMKAMFGLQLSDKGHDHNTDTPSDETWWRETIAAHRAAGLPLDHVVNDNRWRAGGGKRCESRIEWDSERYPDPAAWQHWLEAEGLVLTLDFNRCIARFSDGWQPAFNLPPIDNIEFADSAPDLTDPDFRRWFWQVFYEQSLDPALGFPGDALWIDEFDEQGAADKQTILANGRSLAEMRNYWFFLIAKALVADGWDASGIDRRPFVWVRGMTAGAQRYATLWSGDIKPNEDDMAAQVRAMQLAGLAGFPFWGHDAGGFFDWDARTGPDESLYQRWAMALGAFSPIWKPHGMGQSRWPLDRNELSRDDAAYYGARRYELMPYLYSAAHDASERGVPIVRPMLLDYTEHDAAWRNDLQFLFGPDLIVAPVVDGVQDVWLPPGDWYLVDGGKYFRGDRTVPLRRPDTLMPVLARAGAIVPQRRYAQSTAFLNKSELVIHVYAGADGRFRLIEDDDRSEAYRDGARRVTELRYDDATRLLTVDAAQGDYAGAPDSRTVTVRFTSSAGTRELPSVTQPVSRPLTLSLAP
ncbi:MAG: TIM-barrel domain-containing protein [Pseudomonadota bacterium]